MLKRFLLVLLPVLFFACSTEKNTSLRRGYQNLTSHYNIYFNARESYKQAHIKLNEGYQEDFSLLIPVFKLADKNLVSSMSSDLDRTISKCSNIISYHSITAKPEKKTGFTSEKEIAFYNKKQYNKWVDDALMLMGKSYYYKQEYYLALQTFRYVINEFKEEPAAFEAQIWLDRTNLELKDYEDVKQSIELLNTGSNLPEKLQKDFLLTKANYYIKTEDFQKALESLEEAFPLFENKEEKVRYRFLVAQLYDALGEQDNAVANFRQVLELKPSYEMAFISRVKIAQRYVGDPKSNQQIITELNKMLKDKRNEDFKDKVYYALGVVYQNQGDTAKALENYKLACANSALHSKQLARAYLTIADIYYQKPDYLMAQAYYDSTLSKIDVNYPDYDEISIKARSLTKLALNLKNVQIQDSLQVFARMSESERLRAIDNIITQVRAEEQAQRLEEQKRQEEANYGKMLASESNTTQQEQSGGKWYFYNPTMKSSGENEFIMRWGRRKLEDDWRRINKGFVFDETAFETIPEELQDTTPTLPKTKDNKSREYYLQNIPLEDSALKASDAIIKNSLYAIGLIYKNELKDYDEATKTFEDLARRYPATYFAAEAYYQLYDLYKSIGNNAKMDLYVNILINKYPESVYAKILSDPEFIKQLQAEAAKVSQYYEQTYQLYESGRFTEVLANVNHAMVQFKSDKLIIKFELLKIMAISKIEPPSVLRESINAFVTKYPDTDEAKFAFAINDFIGREQPEIVVAEEQKKAEEIYVEDLNDIHYVLFSLPPDQNLINQLNFNLISFNIDNYAEYNFTVESEDLTASTRTILIRSFVTSREAMAYYQKVLTDTTVYQDINTNIVLTMIISEKNLQTLRNDKSINRYYQFFKSRYQ